MNQEVLKAKKQQVEEITNDIKKSNAVVICEYRGLTVDQLLVLRRNLREVNAKMGVFKNSLVERAVDTLGYKELEPLLEGPNAYIFSEDVIAGPKILRKFARMNEKFVIKGGLIEGKFANAKQIDVIGRLPGREGLISMFLSVLQAPTRNFACAIKAIADAKAN